MMGTFDGVFILMRKVKADITETDTRTWRRLYLAAETILFRHGTSRLRICRRPLGHAPEPKVGRTLAP